MLKRYVSCGVKASERGKVFVVTGRDLEKGRVLLKCVDEGSTLEVDIDAFGFNVFYDLIKEQE